MEQFFYTETMTVMNADADFRSLLKPSALLRYVEQISADHARAFGMDDQFFKDRGVTFLVGKQALKFDRVPQRAETLTLTSRAQVSKHGSVKRITTLTDAEGKEVAMVDCRWIVASLTEGRILREPGWTVENFWNDTVEGELPGLESSGTGEVKAETGGIVTVVSAEAGRTVRQGETLLTLADPAAYEIAFSVSEELVSQLQAGDPVSIYFSWQGSQAEPVQGTLLRVSYVQEGAESSVSASTAGESPRGDTAGTAERR